MQEEKTNEVGYYYNLFKFFSDNHGLTLVDSEIQDIIRAVNSFEGTAELKAENERLKAKLSEVIGVMEVIHSATFLDDTKKEVIAEDWLRVLERNGLPSPIQSQGE